VLRPTVGPRREIKTNQGSEGVDFVPPTPITGVKRMAGAHLSATAHSNRLQHIQKMTEGVQSFAVSNGTKVQLTRESNDLYTSALPKGSLNRSSSRGTTTKSCQQGRMTQ